MTIQQYQPSGLAQTDNNMAIALARFNDKAQLAVIRDQICVGATASEMWVFLARCVALGLDPFSRQIYFVKRETANGPVVAHQIGIDGFRSIAERTGELVGITEPEYEGQSEVKGVKVPGIARVTVTREIRGKDRQFTASARWSEFYPGEKLGFMWHKMPYHMLGKCAEAQAMRRAFPQQMGGLQTDGEAMSFEGVQAASVVQRIQDGGRQYLEVTDTETGEIRRVSGADEYERTFAAAYPDEAEKPAETQHANERSEEEMTVSAGPGDATTSPAEHIDLDYCHQLWEQAQREGIDLEPPDTRMKAAELRSYAKTLGDMMAAQAKQREEARI